MCVCSSLCSHMFKDLCVYKHVYKSTVSRCAYVPVCVYECGHEIVCACVYVGVFYMCNRICIHVCESMCPVCTCTSVCLCVSVGCVCTYPCVSACLCVSCTHRGGGGPEGCRSLPGFPVPDQEERSPSGGGVGPPATLTLPGLLQKAPSASDSDSKAESDAAKAEPVPPVRSPSSSSASSSSSDSEVSVKKPPRGRKPGRLTEGAARGLGLVWWVWGRLSKRCPPTP